MSISVNKKDVLWGYIAQFFSIGTGLITLPLILNRLSSEEVGFNYILLSVGALVSLCDFGFAPQFGRNITYVLSGARRLKPEGLDSESVRDGVDYHLLLTVIKTAQNVYKYISAAVLLLLLSVGTIYINHVTHGFSNVNNALLIWLTYSVSVFFNIYFKYYSSLLVGSAKIVESKKALIVSRSVYIVLCYVLLLCGVGLLSVVISNFIAPFIERFLSYRWFYTKEMKEKLRDIKVEKSEIRSTFNTIWFTSKWLGLNMLGSYAYNQSGTFISGLFLSLDQVASYGLMLQFFNIISSFSGTLIVTMQPNFCAYHLTNNKERLSKEFSMGIIILWCIYILGVIGVAFVIPPCLRLIGSNSVLPQTYLVVFFGIEALLHDNHAQCGTYISTKNKVPFVIPSLITGFFVIVFTLVFLKYFSLGILGIILARFIVEIAYNHWKWPVWVLNDLELNTLNFIRNGFEEIRDRIQGVLK